MMRNSHREGTHHNAPSAAAFPRLVSEAERIELWAELLFTDWLPVALRQIVRCKPHQRLREGRSRTCNSELRASLR
jgi:hypothetical protein